MGYPLFNLRFVLTLIAILNLGSLPDASSADSVNPEMDEDEFDGFAEETMPPSGQAVSSERKGGVPSKADLSPSDDEIKIVNIGGSVEAAHGMDPLHGYHWEFVILLASLGYVVLYIRGRLMNKSIADNWFENCRTKLTEEFALIGDRPCPDGDSLASLVKENDATYRLWCSGRKNLDGMLVTLDLKPRFCALQTVVIANKPADVTDRCSYVIDLDRDLVDTFVLLVGCDVRLSKSVFSSRVSECPDLADFCIERKSQSRTFSHVYSELNDPVDMLEKDGRVKSIVSKRLIRFIHISDRYGSGTSVDRQENAENSDGLNDCWRSVLHIEFYLGNDELCLEFALYLVDRLSQYRLNKEAKARSVKNRQMADERAQKLVGRQRQEMAKQRRELKRKALMSSTDPEQLRRMEDKQNKRDSRKRQMKTMIIRST